MNTITIGGILFLALLVGLALSSPSIAKIVRIHRTPTTWISALPAEGQVEVIAAVSDKTILSPINNTPCAAYKVEVQQLKKSNKGSHWSTVKEIRSETPIELNDGTASIQVYPAGADLIVSLDSQSDELTEAQLAAIQSLGIELKGFFGSEKHFKVNEYVIRPKEEIYVLGQIRQANGVKSIASDGQGSFVISAQGEQWALRTLYYRIIKYMLICLGVGILAIILIASYNS